MKANSKDRPQWAKQEWLILLSCDTRTLSFSFYGGGAVETPKVIDALWSLGIEYLESETSFTDWASECGYDTDSLSARKTFDSMLARSRELDYLMGSTQAAYEVMLSAREY